MGRASGNADAGRLGSEMGPGPWEACQEEEAEEGSQVPEAHKVRALELNSRSNPCTVLSLHEHSAFVCKMGQIMVIIGHVC